MNNPARWADRNLFFRTPRSAERREEGLPEIYLFLFFALFCWPIFFQKWMRVYNYYFARLKNTNARMLRGGFGKPHVFGARVARFWSHVYIAISLFHLSVSKMVNKTPLKFLVARFWSRVFVARFWSRVFTIARMFLVARWVANFYIAIL